MPRKREACILQDQILDRLRKSLFEHHQQEQLLHCLRTLPNYDDALPAIARKIIGFPILYTTGRVLGSAGFKALNSVVIPSSTIERESPLVSRNYTRSCDVIHTSKLRS